MKITEEMLASILKADVVSQQNLSAVRQAIKAGKLPEHAYDQALSWAQQAALRRWRKAKALDYAERRAKEWALHFESRKAFDDRMTLALKKAGI